MTVSWLQPALRPLAVGLGVVILAAGCSANSEPNAGDDGTDKSSSSSPPGTKTPPPPPPPKTDTCRALGFSDIGRYSNTTATLPCDEPHTAYTFAVKNLPSDIAFEGVQIKNDAIQQQAGESCLDAFVKYVGGDAATRARVRLTVTYFLPDQRAFDRGAHWVRCDIIALQAEQILADLPPKLEGLLDDDSAIDDYGLCSTGEPGTNDSTMVMCNQEHTYRAIAALRLGSTSESYPGESVTNTDGKQRCEDLIVDLLDEESGFTFSWTFPTPADWHEGQRFGYCWNKTTG